jgi:RHS repeat-associated protein
LTGITGVRPNGAGVQNISYGQDLAGHLNLRVDGNRNVTETFDHDSHDRLSHWTFATFGGSAWDFTYQYSADGNLVHRKASGPNATGVSLTYGYGGTVGTQTQPPHAVTSISTEATGPAQISAYVYDNHGNQITRNEFPAPTFIDYTDFNLPKSIKFDGQPATTLAYDADNHRTLVQRGDGSKTFYAGELYERRVANGAVNGTNVYYVPGGDRIVAQVVWTEQPQTGMVATRDTIYLHDDHLGSVETITGPTVGTQSFKYEPFGKRIGLTDPTQSAFSPNATVTRGYAFLEHDDSFSGLINMRGRMYDPKVGRFLSPDPLVSNPFNSQSYNRFSYVANNPLTLVDPTGFQEQGGPSWIAKIWNAIFGSGKSPPPAPEPASPPTAPPEPAPTTTTSPSDTVSQPVGDDNGSRQNSNANAAAEQAAAGNSAKGHGPPGPGVVAPAGGPPRGEHQPDGMSSLPTTWGLKLPADPSTLPPEWVRDPSHLDPNGIRYRHPSGDVLDFHKGRTGLPGWRGKDHWHRNGEDKHLLPGEDVPDPVPMSVETSFEFGEASDAFDKVQPWEWKPFRRSGAMGPMLSPFPAPPLLGPVGPPVFTPPLIAPEPVLVVP